MVLVLKTSSLSIPNRSGLDSNLINAFNSFKEVAEKEQDLTKHLCVRTIAEDMTDREAFEEGLYEFYSLNPFAEEMIDIMTYLVGYDMIILKECDILTEV